ncbi:activating transcription factor 4b isoform X2 [Salarias fasciatus]|uniref:activating transcription factor 4b isoform X2 n=1 Tax=Salarias fasciatus TaxID=181472 RepID=UPI001176DD2F|nr:cyclic AMP-dependent transcription factor ATF-4-like isoform X2 [Salarias fasciatus]
MTMMMTSSQFGLEDMEAILWGPSSPMADAVDSLMFHPDTEDKQSVGGTSLEGDTAPVSPLPSSSLSSSSSPPPFYSPPPSPPATLLHGDKVGPEPDLLSLSWFSDPGQLRSSQTLSGDGRDMLSDLDWMAEKMDLSEFDLDSLIDACSPPEESPASPEDLLASLDCPMDLETLPLPHLSAPVPPSLPSESLTVEPPPIPDTVCSDAVITDDELESFTDGQEVPSSPLCVPEPQEELEIKSEPASPDPPPPVVDSPSSPAYTLDLGSEVDVSETEVKPVVAAAVVPQLPRLVLSLSPTRIVLVLARQSEVALTTAPEVTRCSPPASPPQTSSRSRPYPDPRASPPSPTVTCIKVKAPRGAERAALKMPKDKKTKKMEQNKTAATRYRQKKRAEHDALAEEHAMLERKNVELTEKAESMSREIEYLKELMEEVRTTRLKIGLTPDP